MEYKKGSSRITKIETFEKGLLEDGTLRFDNLSSPIRTRQKYTLKTFIFKLLSDYNTSQNTVNSNNIAIVQCDKNKRRSAGDIFRICKYYYPNCNLRQVLRNLSQLSNENMIRTSMCGQINKRVYYHSLNPDVFEREQKDEFNHEIDEYLNI